MTSGRVKTRQAKLEVLIAEAGSLKAIGEAMRRAAVLAGDPKAAEKDYANVVSQLRGGKNIGDKLARLLEASMGKPEDWLDSLQLDAIDQAMEARESAQLAMNMPKEKREMWLQMGRLWAAQGPPNAGRPFINLNPPSDAPKPAPKGTKKTVSRGKPKPKRRRKGGGNA